MGIYVLGSPSFEDQLGDFAVCPAVIPEKKIQNALCRTDGWILYLEDVSPQALNAEASPNNNLVLRATNLSIR